MLLPWFALALLQTADIRTTVPLVLAPATVTDAKGRLVEGLTAEDFIVYDGATPRPHELEVSDQPLSIVTCVQSSAASGPALAKLVKVGSMIQPLLAGETGEAALLSYSDTVTVRQEFTPSEDLISLAFRRLEPDGFGSRMLDCAQQAIEMLEQRPRKGRRVLLVVGESRDRSSEATLESVLERTARSNVTVYPVTYSLTWTAFTSRGQEHFGNPKDPNYETKPRVVQAGPPNYLGGLGELARLGKPNAAEALARATGGMKLSFVKLSGLEDVLRRTGEDLHNQYLLTFAPAGGEAGFRTLRIEVKGRPELQVRARPGYWYVP